MTNSNEEIDLAWAAGVVSVLGSLAAVKVVRKKKWGYGLYTRLQVGSRGSISTIKELGRISRAEVKTVTISGKQVYRITLNADALHEFFKKIWPWLAVERKTEYKKVRQMVAASEITEDEETGDQESGRG